MSFKHNRALPLELFDNPETEVVQPETRIVTRAADTPGVSARSRYYNSRGEFAWASCHVLSYDRYTSEACRAFDHGCTQGLPNLRDTCIATKL